MFGLLIFGMIAIVVAVYFWYLELKFYLDNMYYPKQSQYQIIAWMQRVGGVFVNIARLFSDGKYFLIDMFVTLMFTSMLGMGEGVTGGVLGLFLSNAISVLLLVVMRRQRLTRLNMQIVQ